MKVKIESKFKNKGMVNIKLNDTVKVIVFVVRLTRAHFSLILRGVNFESQVKFKESLISHYLRDCLALLRKKVA